MVVPVVETGQLLKFFVLDRPYRAFTD